MIRRPPHMLPLASIGVLALAAGAVAAQTAAGGTAASPAPPRAPAAPGPALVAPATAAPPAFVSGGRALVPARPVTPVVAPAGPLGGAAHAVGGAAHALRMRDRLRLDRMPAPAPGRPAIVFPVPMALPVAPCRAGDRAGARTAPNDALRNTFAILRRERTDADALPAEALAELKARGLAPVDPRSARLLRADGAARAWVVPVPDIDAAIGLVACVRGGDAGSPREGLAVVALGGAPAGGGGALHDLQRGLPPAAVDPCAGAAGDMLGVSGIVPDGVEAVFITAADGTATRADVRDNGYAFVLPRARRPEQRYLVWTGGDGAPHVQPLPVLFAGVRGAWCATADPPPRVTPDPWGASCGPLVAPTLPAAAAIGRAAKRRLAARPKHRVPRRPPSARAPRRLPTVPARPRPIRRPPILLTCAPFPQPLAALPGPARAAPPIAARPRPRRGP